MLAQPDHVDEHLREWLKCQNEESRKCILKIILSISYLSLQGIAIRKVKQDDESNFKQVLLLRTEDGEVLRKGLKSRMTCIGAQIL